MVYLNETYGKVTYDKTLNAVCAKLIGFIGAEPFKKIIDTELKAFKQEKASAFLIDLTELKVMPAENQKYVQEYWIPQIKALGAKRVAFLEPEDIFGQVSMKNANVQIEDGLETAYFSDLKRAHAWLLSPATDTSKVTVMK